MKLKDRFKNFTSVDKLLLIYITVILCMIATVAMSDISHIVAYKKLRTNGSQKWTQIQETIKEFENRIEELEKDGRN